jgi:N-acetylglucosaminyl-diphospho-decaprenol L-rhamnosyltransferase
LGAAETSLDGALAKLAAVMFTFSFNFRLLRTTVTILSMRDNISAIVLDYRGAAKTKQCLLSLRNQGIKTTYVLDNSELESSSTELKSVIEQIRQAGTDYRVELLSAGKNLGFGKGVNFVLLHDRASQSPHDYYLLLNNDALAGPSLVSGLMAALQQNPEVALVAPRIISEDPTREYGIWYHRYFGLLLLRPGIFRFHYLTGCCLLFSKDLVGDKGLFNEGFFMYGEDVDLGWRLTRQGLKMICAPDVFVKHDLGPSAGRTALFYEYHMVRGHLLLSWITRLHPLEIPFLIITKYSSIACRAVSRSFRYHSLVPLAALFLAWVPLKVTKP